LGPHGTTKCPGRKQPEQPLLHRIIFSGRMSELGQSATPEHVRVGGGFHRKRASGPQGGGAGPGRQTSTGPEGDGERRPFTLVPVMHPGGPAKRLPMRVGVHPCAGGSPGPLAVPSESAWADSAGASGVIPIREDAGLQLEPRRLPRRGSPAGRSQRLRNIQAPWR
jgi:hypothetical protein